MGGITTDSLQLMRELSQSTPSKIVMLVIDGLGGLPDAKTGKTEMETAKTPNLDRLAARGMCGLSQPIGYGITPGSAPGHLALFGYDPVAYNIGRGVLEALGIDFELQPGDVAARGNFCTVDGNGIITDRRAGRITTEKSAELCRLLDGMSINSTRVLVSPVREHRFAAIFRGKDLSSEVSDSDPGQVGKIPVIVAPLKAEAAEMAKIANEFLARASRTLAKHHPANMVLLRGFSQHPHLPTMQEIYKLKPAAIASYPMYRGLAKLLGMAVLATGATIDKEFATLKQSYEQYDFFFLHVKGADSAGEDGDFARKVSVIEQFDSLLPEVTSLNPDVIIVTGDHSTPALLKAHSWHPVPLLLYSPWCRPDRIEHFGESACASGELGVIPATQIMPLAMAHALKLNKFGA